MTRQFEAEFRRLTGPILGGEGLELVDVALKGSPGRQVLRLDIDRPGADGVDLADCQRVSRALEQELDRTDLITGGYVLEVSSPGLDRPIRSADDIRRNTGRRVVVTVSDGSGEQRAYRGTLLGCLDGELRLEGEDREEIRIPMDGVVTARREVAL
ncbi:MAG: ribosome maturation factor RimP [Planctomycetota bacterium]